MKQFIKCPECGEVQVFDFSNMWQKCKKCDETIIDQHVKPLKAISIRQPWAWLIVNGYKPLENRSTLKNFRGDVLIHASVNREDMSVLKNLVDNGTITSRMVWDSLGCETGGIVGIATFTGSVTESDSPWFVGPNAFTIENARPLPFTPCKGALGFFTPKID